MLPRRTRVLDTPVDVVSMEDALAFVEQHVRNGSQAGSVLAVNPEKVFVLREDAVLRRFFEKAALLLPDGIGIVIAVRLLKGIEARRVPGANLMLRLCAEAVEKRYRLFIYGSEENVNEHAVDVLRHKHPGIDIVGRANGYVPGERMGELVSRINDSGAEILFVGLGSPRQERWIHDHIEALTSVKLCLGVGGTLDTIAGKVKRAPRFLRHNGLEWLYRLIQQPTRIRRQVRLVRFAWEVMWETSGCRLRKRDESKDAGKSGTSRHARSRGESS